MQPKISVLAAAKNKRFIKVENGTYFRIKGLVGCCSPRFLNPSRPVINLDLDKNKNTETKS